MSFFTIEPGKVTTVEFVADRAGEFTFYCTIWCDPNHARMRGILEVRGQAVTETARPYAAPDILLQHLDVPRDAGVVPAAVPSAARGLSLYEQRCASCHGERGEETSWAAAIARREALADASPFDVFQILTGARMQRGSPQVGAHGQGFSTVSKAIPSHAQ